MYLKGLKLTTRYFWHSLFYLLKLKQVWAFLQPWDRFHQKRHEWEHCTWRHWWWPACFSHQHVLPAHLYSHVCIPSPSQHRPPGCATTWKGRERESLRFRKHISIPWWQKFKRSLTFHSLCPVPLWARNQAGVWQQGWGRCSTCPAAFQLYGKPWWASLHAAGRCNLYSSMPSHSGS